MAISFAYFAQCAKPDPENIKCQFLVFLIRPRPDGLAVDSSWQSAAAGIAHGRGETGWWLPDGGPVNPKQLARNRQHLLVASRICNVGLPSSFSVLFFAGCPCSEEASDLCFVAQVPQRIYPRFEHQARRVWVGGFGCSCGCGCGCGCCVVWGLWLSVCVLVGVGAHVRVSVVISVGVGTDLNAGVVGTGLSVVPVLGACGWAPSVPSPG